MDIRAERVAAGLSQAELAALAGVPQPNLSAYENGRRGPSPAVTERLTRALAGRPHDRIAKHRRGIRDTVAACHTSDPRVFGSVARGEDTAGSDVDILVQFTDEASLLDEVALRLALTDLLRVEVDLVAEDTLRGASLDRLQAIPL
ncbi:helix-turn-helix domain-containing protein [Flexivirga caeni]|uniref:Helix-turn-helix domain-containing protein n=1 Tax=Flexivirga caeni TaxID=2294115 RepID=A0A3M9MHX0_9MICO|nr:helix-turn-helix domain-containing protein [Flexivirga caeni]RNI24258.1 helix-turn-helix domain-containing protein [Flexivirga caeni]